MQQDGNSFDEASITVMLKPNKTSQGRKTIDQMSHEHRCKTAQNNVSKSNPICI